MSFQNLVLWTATYFCLTLGLKELQPVWFQVKHFFTENRAIVELRKAVYHLKLLQEMLETGNVPEASEWKKIAAFPAPWGEVLSQSVSDLKDQGAPVLPTLGRIQKTLEDQVEFILEAKTKSSQAFGQAILGLMLVPGFGLILYFMMPGVQDSPRAFFSLVVFSMLLAVSAFLWMMSMTENARFGNLRTENRRWLVSVHSTLERVLALISTGNPPDLAWKKAMEELSGSDQTLVAAWKLQVWDPDFRVSHEVDNESARLILGVGQEVRKSIQTSLLEGRPCVDRIESIHRAFQTDLRALISRELSLLPNRCLKPLFIFVLPAVMILMFGCFAISFQDLI
jgi:hypothetical protein